MPHMASAVGYAPFVSPTSEHVASGGGMGKDRLETPLPDLDAVCGRSLPALGPAALSVTPHGQAPFRSVSVAPNLYRFIQLRRADGESRQLFYDFYLMQFLRAFYHCYLLC